jgi:hypothetical protein
VSKRYFICHLSLLRLRAAARAVGIRRAMTHRSSVTRRSGPERSEEPKPRSNSNPRLNYLAAFFLPVFAVFLSCGAEA